MSKRQKYDRKQPGAQALADSITHGAAVTEGTMVAFPTCFPNVTVPVRADESRITAMDVTPEGIVYAGTSGYASHLLVGMFHGITGVVFDMGVVENGDHCTAMCCGKSSFVAAVNGPSGGRLVTRALQPLRLISSRNGTSNVHPTIMSRLPIVSCTRSPTPIAQR